MLYIYSRELYTARFSTHGASRGLSATSKLLVRCFESAFSPAMLSEIVIQIQTEVF